MSRPVRPVRALYDQLLAEQWLPSLTTAGFKPRGKSTARRTGKETNAEIVFTFDTERQIEHGYVAVQLCLGDRAVLRWLQDNLIDSWLKVSLATGFNQNLGGFLEPITAYFDLVVPEHHADCRHPDARTLPDVLREVAVPTLEQYGDLDELMAYWRGERSRWKQPHAELFLIAAHALRGECEVARELAATEHEVAKNRIAKAPHLPHHQRRLADAERLVQVLA